MKHVLPMLYSPRSPMARQGTAVEFAATRRVSSGVSL